MIAFHGDPAIKEKYLARVMAHAIADEIVQGKYWENGKGCAVGCTIHGSDHGNYETELGIPRSIARIEDGIFEGLINGNAKKFPEQFLSAIPVGADLSLVTPKFLVWLLIDAEHGVLKFARTDEQRSVISKVAEMYQRQIEGETIAPSDWRDVRDAAWNVRRAAYDAAAAAADAAADAADAAASDAYAAYAAADAAYAAAYDAYAAYAAADAAYAAAYDAAAADAARIKMREAQRDKLLELLRTAEVK